MMAPTGIFEGYLKKRKNIGALTLISDSNKRYFLLDLPTYSLVYFKNRKKGKKNTIPLQRILFVSKLGDNDEVISGKEWSYPFRIITTERQYDFRAFSFKDREVWVSGFEKILEYKKAILAKRSINIDDLKVDEYTRPGHEVYHLRPTDFDHKGKIKALSDIPFEELQDPRYINEAEGEEEEEVKDHDSHKNHHEEFKNHFGGDDERFRRNLMNPKERDVEGMPDTNQPDVNDVKAKRNIQEFSDDQSTDRNEGNQSSNSADSGVGAREPRNSREERLETDQKDDLDDCSSFERTNIRKIKASPTKKKSKIKQIKLKNITKDPEFKENQRQGNSKEKIGEDFKGTRKTMKRDSDPISKEVGEKGTFSQEIPLKKVRTQAPDEQRKSQLNSLAPSGSYFTQNTEKFDLVIEHDDNEFNHISDEGPSTPKKRKPEPMPKEYQLANTESKVITRKSRTSIEAPKIVNKEKSESPIRKRKVNSNQHLLSEWEKKYGTRNDRRICKDVKEPLDQWGVEPYQSNPSPENLDGNLPESPTGDVQVTGNIAGEFEYDWDNEDGPEVSQQKKLRMNQRSMNNSRVPVGAMEYAATKFNN
ncbi:unnamed protein product [Moneuplotes crassus]|uniref:PH domain-containing protein n=1 Tax=Euplotes crassus TaxID=5936 RepID=A0AAD1U2J8_EUPCR|nr:unnamed protein product [Moneuplotes crassus]